MARDVPPDVPPEFGWALVERGSFLFGRCDACGYQTPGRRARYSAEADMGAHAVICHASRTVGLDDVPEDVEAPPERSPEPV